MTTELVLLFPRFSLHEFLLDTHIITQELILLQLVICDCNQRETDLALVLIDSSLQHPGKNIIKMVWRIQSLVFDRVLLQPVQLIDGIVDIEVSNEMEKPVVLIVHIWRRQLVTINELRSRKRIMN